MILVTGATGHLGGATVEHLLKHLAPHEFAILARDENKAKSFAQKGIEVRLGDFDDINSLERALSGITKILLIPTIVPHRLEQNKRVVDSAVKNKVKHILYTGISFKNINETATAGLEAHFETEDYIMASGLSYTFLRNNLYMEALPFYGGAKLYEQGFYLPAGKGKVPFALRREMGEAAATVLLQEGHENKIYEIAASELYTYDDVANALSKLVDKTITYTDADPETFKRILVENGLDEFMISILTGFNVDIKNGHFETLTYDLEKLIGRKPIGLEKGLAEVFELIQK